MTDTATETTAATFNPFSPGFVEDPYPHYAELRRTNPVEKHDLGFWALWRYADVAEVLRARLSVEDGKVATPGPMAAVYEEALAEQGLTSGVQSMLDRDPPDHTRLRKLVSQAFTPRTIQALEPTITSLV